MDTSFTFRPATLDDLEPLATLYTHHWCNYVPDLADKMLAARHCVLIQLVRSPLNVIAEQDGALVGVCLGCLVHDGRAPIVDAWVPAYERIHAEGLERAITADDDLEGAIFGDQRELDKADDFIAQGSPYAEAQLNLIMVEPWLKGQGLGTALFDHMTALMRESGARHFFLMSDTSSDYAYYEHRGMKRIASYPDDPSDPDSWAALMYGGDLA